jgi:tetratricopeptide (TPR) repeat protein
MKIPVCASIACLCLAGCAAAPVAPAPQLFHDTSFAAPSIRINSVDVFAISPAMRHYLSDEISDQLRAEGRQQGLFDALYRKDQLKLEYDAAITRTAAQAFDARSGNCLSLVIMTAAFAKELGLAVHYQRVYTDEAWNRRGDIYFTSGHINLSLIKKNNDPRVLVNKSNLMTIDFYPLGELETQHGWEVEENTVVAMYMNNRAAETLVDGNVDNAYWWAREAISKDPSFLLAYNTLGVIYRRHGNLADAEAVFDFVLKHEPQNAQALSNLILVMDAMGRKSESAILTAKLKEIEPYPPYYFFIKAQKSMLAKDFKAARDLFAKEIKREPTNPEFNFWMATAYIGLGDTQLAQKYLGDAIEYSTTRNEHDLYAAKLDRIRTSIATAARSGS